MIYYAREVKDAMKKAVSVLLSAVIMLTMLPGCSEENKPMVIEDSADITDLNTSDKEEVGETIIIDDDYITASFEKMYDATALGVEGVFYLDIYAENKTEKEIWVYLENASVNDEAVSLVGSAVPLYIQSGQSGRNAFMISFAQLSIDTIDKIKNITFDLVIADKETLSEIERATSISIDF